MLAHCRCPATQTQVISSDEEVEEEEEEVEEVEEVEESEISPEEVREKLLVAATKYLAMIRSQLGQPGSNMDKVYFTNPNKIIYRGEPKTIFNALEERGEVVDSTKWRLTFMRCAYLLKNTKLNTEFEDVRRAIEYHNVKQLNSRLPLNVYLECFAYMIAVGKNQAWRPTKPKKETLARLKSIYRTDRPLLKESIDLAMQLKLDLTDAIFKNTFGKSKLCVRVDNRDVITYDYKVIQDWFDMTGFALFREKYANECRSIKDQLAYIRNHPSVRMEQR